MNYIVTYNEYDETFNIFLPRRMTVNEREVLDVLKNIKCRMYNSEGDQVITGLKTSHA